MRAQIDEYRANARRDRGKVRDLQNQLFLLRDKVETARVEASRVDEPQLPVELVEPAPGEVNSYGETIMGVDAEGNEIVYVGEAARDRSVAPSMDRYLTEAERHPRTVRRPRPVSDGPAMREPTDRIPTTSSRAIPTVANQLRTARRPPLAVRARGSVETAGPRALYQRHYAALRAGNHTAALAGFRAFVQKFPEHSYADNAQYWLGEVYYDQKQYKRAMREFRRVVKRYPRGNKVPDALLKIGYCYAALGETMKALDVLSSVARVYPSSTPAVLAARKMSAMAVPVPHKTAVPHE